MADKKKLEKIGRRRLVKTFKTQPDVFQKKSLEIWRNRKHLAEGKIGVYMTSSLF